MRYAAKCRFLLPLSLLITTTMGCGALPHLVYWVKGVPVHARFGDLEEKRVAVVCVANEQAFGDSGVSEKLARGVAAHLRREVHEIEVVHENEIEKWTDDTGWDHVSYPDVGKGVAADMVVAIDLARFQTDAGAHLFQGKADYQVKVFDMAKGGELVYRRQEEGFEFPKGGHPASGKSAGAFKRLFVQVLAREIAKDFFDYQMTEDFAEDAAYIE